MARKLRSLVIHLLLLIGLGPFILPGKQPGRLDDRPEQVGPGAPSGGLSALVIIVVVIIAAFVIAKILGLI
jgi:hypothetical protein